MNHSKLCLMFGRGEGGCQKVVVFLLKRERLWRSVKDPRGKVSSSKRGTTRTRIVQYRNPRKTLSKPQNRRKQIILVRKRRVDKTKGRGAGNIWKVFLVVLMEPGHLHIRSHPWKWIRSPTFWVMLAFLGANWYLCFLKVALSNVLLLSIYIQGNSQIMWYYCPYSFQLLKTEVKREEMARSQPTPLDLVDCGSYTFDFWTPTFHLVFRSVNHRDITLIIRLELGKPAGHRAIH